MLDLARRAEVQNYNELFTQTPKYYSALLQTEGLALLIYENDTLKFWSDNSIAVENWIKEVCLDSKMAKLRNGWFEVMHPHTNSSTTKTIVGLILIKNEYPYQNKYLVNEFQKDFSLPAETKLIKQASAVSTLKQNAIKNYKGDYLFSLQLNATSNSHSFNLYISVVLNIIGFIFIVLFFKNSFLPLSNRIKKNIAVLAFVFVVLFLRYLTIRFSFPESFYSFDLFSPEIYADAGSVWLTSLGDLLINVILLFYLSFFIFKEFNFDTIFSKFKSLNKLAISLLFFLGYFWLSGILTSLFVGLIKNSNIPFSINNIFSLNQYSYTGIIIIGVLLFTYFLFADKMIVVLKQLKLNNRQYVFVFLVSAGIHIVISHLLGTLDLVVIFWPFVLMFSIALLRQKQSS